MALRYPWESGKHLDFWGRESHGSPTRLFFGLGDVIFPLLEYHDCRGMPTEGRVLTQKATQSRKWGEKSAIQLC